MPTARVSHYEAGHQWRRRPHGGARSHWQSDERAVTTAAQKDAQRNRNTIFVEDGELLVSTSFRASSSSCEFARRKCAAAAKPGSFVHVTCDDSLPMRRPLSIMRVEDDCIDVLYKIVGDGLR